MISMHVFSAFIWPFHCIHIAVTKAHVACRRPKSFVRRCTSETILTSADAACRRPVSFLRMMHHCIMAPGLNKKAKSLKAPFISGPLKTQASASRMESRCLSVMMVQKTNGCYSTTKTFFDHGHYSTNSAATYKVVENIRLSAHCKRQCDPPICMLANSFRDFFRRGPIPVAQCSIYSYEKSSDL